MTSHLKAAHVERWAAFQKEEKEKEAAREQSRREEAERSSGNKKFKDGHLPFCSQAPVAPAEGVHQQKRVVIHYSANDIKKFFSASCARHLRPPNMSRSDSMMKVVFYMASGGSFSPPTPETITRHWRDFDSQLEDNIRAQLVKFGVLSAAGEPQRHPVPIVSGGFDLTTGDGNGLHFISYRVAVIDPASFQLHKISLGCQVFKLSAGDLSPEEIQQGVTSGTGDNLAQWALRLLQAHGLVPPSADVSDIRHYLFAHSTDNAHADCDAVKRMMTFCHTCPAHGNDLCVKDATKSSPDFNRLLDLLSSISQHFKKGNGADALHHKQMEDGVVDPMRLASRSKTRWGMSLRMIVAALRVRK